MAVNIVETCQNTPLNSAEQGQLSYWRRWLARTLVERGSAEPPSPLTAYSIIYGERLDPYIQRRVRAIYKELQKMLRTPANERNDIDALLVRNGFIYVFRDERDPPNILKIGMTTQRSAERRVSQWRQTLADSSNSINLVFSAPTSAASFTEKLLHALLFCRRVHGRVNRTTQQLLVEYFDVGADWQRLHSLVQAVTAHVNWLVARAY